MNDMVEARKGINEKELEILNFWDKDKTFLKSLEKTKDSKPYVFYDGPPFATGLPHYGHLLGSIIKDIYGRFWTMNGRYVRRVWGWDCHGLPIENIAEKGLKINSKDEIEKMGVGKFNHYCRSEVLGYVDDWKKVIRRIGRWVDMDDAYHTMDNSYIESVWWAFKELWKKGYIYEGEKVLMYCPRCSTPLAKAEIAMDNSYKKVDDKSVTVKFKLKDENVYALAWTTTPWTLPSNLGLTVNPKLDYVYLSDVSDGTVYLLAKDLINKFFKYEDDYNIIKEVKGKKLEGIEYEPLFSYYEGHEKAFRFFLGDFVTAEDGTGIVHTAPYGEDDFEVFKKYGVSIVHSVDEKGRFNGEVKDFAGEFIFDTNEKILKFLKDEGKVVSIKGIRHDYPFCYRCDTPLMYMPLPAWFVNIQKIKPRLMKLNKELNWFPGFLKDGRVKYTLETAPDWNISRNRYWATAIPIWKSEDGEELVVGSVEELKKYAKKLPRGKIDLHKHFLDDVILEKDGKEFRRISEVMDCWFESGSMTFAQFHYPFENKAFFEKNFPAQFVAEYIAQIRTWFYYMNVLSAILFDDIPFENIVTTGNILAENGEKMSKSKRNFTDPMVLVEKYGIDALRFYLSGCPVMNAQDIFFSDRQVEEVYKKVIVLMYNVNNFYDLYSKIPDVKLKPKDVVDKWVISRFNQVSKNVDDYLRNYNTIKACGEIKDFVEELSTWYVRQTRDRFGEGDLQVKATLRYVLENLAIISAPIIPFVSERIYQTINGEKSSVHLADWCSSNSKLIDEGLNSRMSLVREIVSRGLRLRDQNGIGLKWPLSKLSIYVKSGFGLEEMVDIIKDQLNVKDVEFLGAKESELEIELDFNLTSELEAEGFAREIARRVQAGRKTAGLVKDDRINLVILSDFDDLLLKEERFVIDRVGAKGLKFSNLKGKYDHSEKGKIRGKSFEFGFVKV